MKTKIFSLSLSLSLSLLVVVLLSLVTIKACNPVVNAGEEADWLTEYQQTLRQVLTQATESNQHMHITEMDQFAANIRQAYIDVLGNQADMDAFENGYRMVASRDVRAKETDTQAESVVQDIIRESDTPEQALELLDELLASRDLDDSQRLEVINTREFLVFLTDNSELITQLRASQVRVKRAAFLTNDNDDSDSESNESDVIEEEGGFWKCAATVASAAGYGSLKGCKTGKFGGIKGCLIGGAIGAASAGIAAGRYLC